MNRNYQDWNGQKYDYDLTSNEPFKEKKEVNYDQYSRRKDLDEDFTGDWDDANFE